MFLILFYIIYGGTCKIDNVKYELNQTLNHEEMLLRFSKLSMMVCCEIK